MINGYTSIKTVLSKLYRDLGTNTEINELDVVEWCAEVLRKVGSYYQFTEVKKCLTLDSSGKVELPCDFDRLVDIAYKSRPLSWASNTIATNYGCANCNIPTCCTEHTFYINNNYIITDIISANGVEETEPNLCVVYLGVPSDENGYPLIPDDVYYLEACAKYCTYMLDSQEWRKGNLPDKVVQKSEQDYLFYVNSARGSANLPGLAQLENIKNVWVRMIPKQNEYNNFFTNNSKQEKRYRY